MKRRDSDRGRGRAPSLRAPLRDDVILQIGASGRSEAPRQGNFKPPVPKQGVNGALRAANLRLLLDKAPVREALALVAEVPLERLEVMSKGGLCPDETAFHIEKALKLPGKWLDGLNKEVPERTLELLKHPEKAGLNDDEVDDEAASLPVISPSASADAAQGTLSLVADKAPTIASVEDMKATRTPAAQAAKPTPTTADLELRPSATAARSKSAPKADRTAPTPELRQRNLSLLLQGKGAKSAMARVIGISQPYMSTIANGGKVLDQDFCRNIAQSLGMPGDWFEAPRTVADIPAVALQRLAPLPRGKAAGAETTLTGDTAPAQAAAMGTAEEAPPKADLAPAQPNAAATAATNSTEGKAVTASVPSEQAGPEEKNLGRRTPRRGDDKQRGNATGPAGNAAGMVAAAPPQADLRSPADPEVALSAPAVPPAAQADVIAAPSSASNPAPVRPAASADAPQTLLAARDISPVSAPPLILEGGLAPITEALIKILAFKDRQGALSEDKAFELLGAVRLL